METAPNLVHTWGLFNQNIGINQIIKPSYLLCWAAKWLDSKEILFSSIKKDGQKKMLQKIHKLMDEADVIVHYNGSSFDIPVLNREFIELGFTPPSSYKQIDLLRTVRKKFRFTSNKLAFVSEFLEIGSKVKHEGHELWVGCMNNEAKSWQTMEKYNKGDVILLQDAYIKLRPWVTNHPNIQVFSLPVETLVERPDNCHVCKSKNLQARGQYRTNTNIYHRFQCKDCGTWSRSRYTAVKKEGKKNLLVSL